MNKNVKRYGSLFLSLCIIMTNALNTNCIVNVKASSNNVVDDIDNIYNQKYSYVSSQYKEKPYTGDSREISIESAIDNNAKLIDAKSINSEYEYKNKVVSMEMGDKAILKIDLPEDGVYYINFDYLDYSNSILPIELQLKLNGDYPFYEARRLVFESSWAKSEGKSYDRYGNEIVAPPTKVIGWENKYIMDASYRHSMPLGLELKKGENIIELALMEGQFVLGNMYLTSAVEIGDKVNSNDAVGDNIYIIEAEYPDYVNDSSIRAFCEYDVKITPYNVENRELNTIDGTSFKMAGQTIEYEVNVEEAGDYYIALQYKQSDKIDFPVFVDVRVDGEIINKAFKDAPLDYSKDYVMKTLDDGNDYVGVYLDKGVHNISFTISIEPICYVIESVENIMGEINDLSLEVTKVAGTNKDKYRDLDIEAYIPGIKEQLLGYADELERLVGTVSVYNEDVQQIGLFYQVNVVATQLRSLAEDPKELTYRISELSTSTSSVTSFLATLLDDLNRNQLYIDKIIIYQDGAELPENPSFFQSLKMNVNRFVKSFSQQDYSVSSKSDDTIQVWVNRPRQYLEIMQTMIDEDFTAKTGIKVDLSLMPDQNKLVLANASGDAPDIATGINYAIPFELSIRGAIVNLTEFDDFKSVAANYSKGLLVPSVVNDGIYSLPETRNFWVLFYRSDILDKLGLEKPETMEDVKNMLPELQMRGLNFFYPTAGMIAMKNFHGTSPLLFQNGATLYGEYAGDTTINSEQAVEGFTELTELFTIYNIPKDVPSFYQHFRNADMPIGISDYATYNLLVNAAPEIANSWEIGMMPGVENEDGEILRYSSGGMESTVMFKSNKDREQQAWEFMKWWSSTEVQSEFGQTLQTTYGDEYMWSTANTAAFASLPIASADKKVIMQQDEWVMEAPRILGTYMLERELSNAYNSVVVDGKGVRITLDKAIKKIDRETERKLEEFGYIKNGEVIKTYEVPTIEKVEEILNSIE